MKALALEQLGGSLLAALLLLLALVGCGEVTEVPGQLQADAGAGDVSSDRGPPSAMTDTPPGGLPETDAGATEGGPPSCVAASCAACPGFAIPGQCAAIVACVRAGGQGEYPWQSCANMHAASLAAAGVACAMQLEKACP